MSHMEGSILAPQVCLPTSHSDDIVSPDRRRRGRQRLRQRHARDRRLIWLLIGVWLVNAFDLELTLLASQQRILVEMNPLGKRIIPYGPAALMAYKFGLLGLGTAVLWRLRRRRLAVVGVWTIAVACVVLSCVWFQLYFGTDDNGVVGALLSTFQTSAPAHHFMPF